MPDAWGIASIIVKFTLYIGVFGATGIVMIRLVFAGLVTPVDRVLRRTAIAAGLLAMAATFASYTFRGAMLTGEASGMIDPEMLGLLWNTPVGAAFATRLSGLLVLILGLVLSGPGRWISVLGGVIALSSFARIGHVLDQGGVFLRLLLLLHLVGISFWIGALLPLKQLAKDEAQLGLAATLGHRFGQIATLVVPALLVAGGLMLWRLAGSRDVIFGTAYGWALMVKIATVSFLLALAAANKQRFVPQMQAGDASAARHLSKSIALEWFTFLFILLVTAILSSVLTLQT